MDNFSLILGDSLSELKNVVSDSVDACITDPPYGLTYLDKEFDKEKWLFRL
ncbi:hypothetical protein FACS1894109_17690 [Spirochaetia bacterium]|nr:hypothetical protein FACS1894109_17690 [Spirochaetia bacterium]